MPQDNAYAWPPRWALEEELRALRASDLWHRPELADGARRRWELLLRDADVDEEGFAFEFDAIRTLFRGAEETVALFRARRGERPRGVPDGVPDRVRDRAPVGSAPPPGPVREAGEGYGPEPAAGPEPATAPGPRSRPGPRPGPELMPGTRLGGKFKRRLRRYYAARDLPLPSGVVFPREAEHVTGLVSAPGSAAAPAPVEEERFLNLAVVWPLSRQAVPKDRVLASGGRYELRVDIGALSSTSLLAEQARPFPEEPLAHTDDEGRGDWLEVTVIGEDFALPEAVAHPLFLPRKGRSWVCPCAPGARHVCEEGHRGRYLHVPFVAPEAPGPARMRVLVSYRGNQLQSVSLTTWVAARESAGGATAAVVDYTLTPGFAGLAELPARTAGVRVGRGADGTMTIDVISRHGPVATFWLGDHQVRDVLEKARAALLDCHALRTGEGEDRRLENALGPDNGKSPEDLFRDMTKLARLGWSFFQMIARGRNERAALMRVLREPAQIQICREEHQYLVFPWSLLYDIPVESQAELVPCAPGWDQVARDASARACPQPGTHGLNTLCPYGFWGYRHFIEHPPSVPRGRRLRLAAGRTGAAPVLTVARSNRLDEHLADRHLATLRTRFRRMDVYDRSAELRRALVADPGDCLYFYGHGRRPRTAASEYSSATVLEIGLADRILPQDLKAWAVDEGWDRWDELAPLVFLNGCHTADRDPASWLGFVDTFIELSASGVIGTEITVDQALAGEFAELFWEALLAGQEVGPALHRVRMELLRKGNVLGLAYTAYCSAALRLRATGR
ncbi:CHAT domain-containing protein [Streptomyces sp. NPDC004284]|uniref:CHAT domain-containing protein n=1 Tax=Streptomyces sp. NPDC004284 TaxID=3364695 RepID=UPI0036C32E78